MMAGIAEMFGRSLPYVIVIASCFVHSGIAVGRLEWESHHYEFSAPPSERKMTVQFACINTGADPVEFKGIHSSCGCAKVVAEPNTIHPGCSGIVRADIDIASHVGARTLRLAVTTNDGDVCELTTQIITPPLGYFIPSTIRWDINGDRKPQRMRFVPFTNQRVQLSRLDFDGATVRAKVVEELLDGGCVIEIFPLSTESASQANIFVFAKVDPEGPDKIHTAVVTVDRELPPSDVQGHTDVTTHVQPDTARRPAGSPEAIYPLDTMYPRRRVPMSQVIGIFCGLAAAMLCLQRYWNRHRYTAQLRHWQGGVPIFPIGLCAASLIVVLCCCIQYLPGGASHVDEGTSPELAVPDKGVFAPATQLETTSEPVSEVKSESRPGLPKLVVDEKAFDFHKVKGEGYLDHSFVMTNRGDADLRLKITSTSSGLLSARLSHSLIPPRSETSVNARLTLIRQDGPQNHAIYLETSDPELQTLTLRLHGMAVQD